MRIEEIYNRVNYALDQLYENDRFLFEKDLCERCLNHKFAYYLQQHFLNEYYVDCEYNKSHLNGDTGAKRVSNPRGNYIDIIITKRDGNFRNDLACLEIKKWNNYRDRDKDIANLEILTNQRDFGYIIGFNIIYGRKRNETKIAIYQNGQRQPALEQRMRNTQFTLNNSF